MREHKKHPYKICTNLVGRKIAYSGEKGRNFFQEIWIFVLEKSVEIFVMVSISDMQSIKYWQNLGNFWIMQNRGFLNNEGLVIHVLHHWQLLEEIYIQDIQKILIMYPKIVMIFCQ